MNFEKDRRILDLNSNLNNSQLYIKRKDKYERLFDYTSFFYLDKDKMQIYQLSDSTVFDKRNITQQELDEKYISLDELLNISEYVGKWMIDALSGKKEYIYYKADGYIIYQCLDSQDISIIITPPEHHNCEQKDTPSISDEFKDKKVMQDLIEKQIKNRIKDKEKKFLPPSPDPYPEYYLSTINSDNDESQINEDDTYGYNNSKTSKSKIYINIEDNTILGSESFYYLDEENNKLYQVCYSFNPIMCYEKKYHKLGDNYISLEEFFDKSTFIGENMVDLNMYIYGLIYKMNDYLLCKKGSKFCLKYRKILYKTDAEQYIHLDEFKDIKHLIHLIQKQIEQTIEDEKKKAEISNLQSYRYNNSRKRR